MAIKKSHNRPTNGVSDRKADEKSYNVGSVTSTKSGTNTSARTSDEESCSTYSSSLTATDG